MGLFQTLLEQPMYNLLIGLYNVLPGADLGFAIIALTVVIKLVLWPLTNSSLKSQRAMQQLQPKLDAIKEQHKDDKEALAKAMMELYSKEKVNPLSSCLPLLIQLPVLIALYRVFMAGLREDGLSMLYPFVSNPGAVNEMFLGLVDLGERSIPLAVLAGAFQFVQTKMLMVKRPPPAVRNKPGAKDEDMMAAMNKSMLYFMPVMTVAIGISLPAGLTLYWVAVSVISVLQQFLVFRKHPLPAQAEVKVIEDVPVNK